MSEKESKPNLFTQLDPYRKRLFLDRFWWDYVKEHKHDSNEEEPPSQK